MAGLTSERTQLDPSRLVRPAVRALAPYRRDPEPEQAPPREIRLDLNESPYGPSPKAKAAIADFATAHRYPEFDGWTLRSAIGRYVGVDPEQVVIGAGLDDVFVTIGALLIDPGDEVIISEPTFGLYRPVFAQRGGVVIDVPLTAEFQLDVDAILAAMTERTKIVVVCNPNNPTGNVFDPAEIERLVANAPCLVLIDEAYAEFAGTTSLPLLATYNNVIIMRTMSKFAGLAGLRVGYAIVGPELVPFAMQVMPAFGNISAVAMAAAAASLDDLEHLTGVVARLVSDRDQLIASLREIPGVEPFPTATNFILMKLPVDDAGLVIDELKRRGIFVRRVANRHHLRVTVGFTADNEAFLHELDDILTTMRAGG